MAKLLIVEDDPLVSDALCNFLESVNFTCDCTISGGDALQLLDAYEYDAIIMDWGLPDMTGFDICVKFRGRGGQTPIIFLTGNDDLSSMEMALDAGADDYIAKPLEIRVLYARLKTILRRRSGSYNPTLTIRGVTLNPASGKLEAHGKEVMLRSKEVAILECLMRHPDTTYTGQKLLDAVWPADAAPAATTVRVWVNYLRQKLAEVGADNLITTVPGAGYIIRT